MASRKLALSASAVAKAIARLEQRLSVVLFARTTRHLTLTEEGIAYQDVCRSARETIEQTEAALRNLSGKPAGTVRVSLPPLFGAQVVAPALYDLTKVWPELHFSIATSTDAADLLAGAADVAVRIGDLPDVSGLVARRLGVQRIALCASADYLAGRSVPHTVDALLGHDLIGNARNGTPVPWQFQRADGELFSWMPPTRLLLAGSLLTLSAIRDGRGMGLMPCWAVQREIDEGRIVTVLDDAIAGHLPVHAIWKSSPIVLPRLRVTIDAIVARARTALER